MVAVCIGCRESDEGCATISLSISILTVISSLLFYFVVLYVGVRRPQAGPAICDLRFVMAERLRCIVVRMSRKPLGGLKLYIILCIVI